MILAKLQKFGYYKENKTFSRTFFASNWIKKFLKSNNHMEICLIILFHIGSKIKL